MKTGPRNIDFVSGAKRLHQALQQDECLHLAGQEHRHQLPPVQAMFVDQPSTSPAQHIAYSTEVIEPVTLGIESCDGTPESTRPALIAIHSPEPKIHDAVPRQTCPRTFFWIVFGMNDENLHDSMNA